MLACFELRIRFDSGEEAVQGGNQSAFLRDQFGITIDFEVSDALAKLERLELISRDGDRITALAPNEALAMLDARWDGLFKFASPI